MRFYILILIFGISFLVTYLSGGKFIRKLIKGGFVVPDVYKKEKLVPTLGGLAIIAGVLVLYHRAATVFDGSCKPGEHALRLQRAPKWIVYNNYFFSDNKSAGDTRRQCRIACRWRRHWWIHHNAERYGSIGCDYPDSAYREFSDVCILEGQEGAGQQVRKNQRRRNAGCSQSADA